jgi:hypothetical protein
LTPGPGRGIIEKMKKAAALALVIVFAACLVHFYYAEDHCPVHCPARKGGFGHVHPHHGGAVCLCFCYTLMSPESCDLPALSGQLVLLAVPAFDHVLGGAATDITPPPRSLLV